jgi:hypothetical protein
MLLVPMGRLGLCSTAAHTCSTYFSSVAETLPHVTLYLEDLESCCPTTLAIKTFNRSPDNPKGPITTIQDVSNSSQHTSLLAIDLKAHKDLLAAQGDVQTRALLNAVTLPHFEDWLNVTPTSSLGFKIQLQESRVAASYSLGIPIYTSSGPCPTCSRENDIVKDLSIDSETDGERISCHDRLCDTICEAASSAVLAPQWKRRDLFPNSTERPGDIFLKLWVLKNMQPLTSLLFPPYNRPSYITKQTGQKRLWMEQIIGR